MRIRLWNDDTTDSVVYEGETVCECQDQAKERISLPGWKHGWSEVL